VEHPSNLIRVMPAKGRERRLTLDDYNATCRALAATTLVVQWGGAHVWKVGGKVFAVAGWSPGKAELAITFKVSALGFDILKDMPGLRPAPYLASRGFTWIQRTSEESMNDAALVRYLRESHRLVSTGLPVKSRIALGLPVDEPRLVAQLPTCRTAPRSRPSQGRSS